MAIKINYTRSFVLFWGATMALAIYTGGILNLAFVLIALLMLVWHEHAHAAHALRSGGTVHEIGFTWLGGYVIAEMQSLVDRPGFFMAGVKNTVGLAIVFIAMDCGAILVFRELSINLAMNPYLNLLNCAVVFAVLLSLSNILPVSYYWKERDILITTDAWAAHISSEGYELWNDGKYLTPTY